MYVYVGQTIIKTVLAFMYLHFGSQDRVWDKYRHGGHIVSVQMLPLILLLHETLKTEKKVWEDFPFRLATTRKKKEKYVCIVCLCLEHLKRFIFAV